MPRGQAQPDGALDRHSQFTTRGPFSSPLSPRSPLLSLSPPCPSLLLLPPLPSSPFHSCPSVLSSSSLHNKRPSLLLSPAFSCGIPFKTTVPVDLQCITIIIATLPGHDGVRPRDAARIAAAAHHLQTVGRSHPMPHADLECHPSSVVFSDTWALCRTAAGTRSSPRSESSWLSEGRSAAGRSKRCTSAHTQGVHLCPHTGGAKRFLPPGLQPLCVCSPCCSCDSSRCRFPPKTSKEMINRCLVRPVCHLFGCARCRSHPRRGWRPWRARRPVCAARTAVLPASYPLLLPAPCPCLLLLLPACCCCSLPAAAAPC